MSDLNVMIRRRHPGTPSDDPAGLEPIPVPDCSVCVALTVERREARAAGDKRTIVEVNREIRAHPHRKTRKR
ncbi:hypothetical protein [Streptomyces sp. NRRL S-87]|uniref:hypothetical protein n=1 Tax=Streptomyces sp. NRRL S-87 TaxID=1463920 RepID=UPI000B155CC3|nr:hypothetical protein [Streptomyces sp. NRRL S-87]